MSFWNKVERPPHLSLRHLKTVTRRRPGRGGEAVYDLVRVTAEPGIEIRLLVLKKPRMTAAQVRELEADLANVIREIERTESDTSVRDSKIYPAVQTESASEALINACDREKVALFDAAGRICISAGGIYIRIEPRARKLVAKPTKRLFVGKSLRAIRVLLSWEARDFGIRALAQEADISFGLAQSVLRSLEDDGFVHRRSAKSGFTLVNYAGLLRTWNEAPEDDTRQEAFYCPSTEAAFLKNAFTSVTELGIDAAFSLGAGIEAHSRFVAGVPLGLYIGHGLDDVVQAFDLQPKRPYNFQIRIPAPVQASRSGGIFYARRDVDVGQTVCEAQLVHDLVRLGGRAKQEGERLLEQLIKDRAEVVSSVPGRT